MKTIRLHLSGISVTSEKVGTINWNKRYHCLDCALSRSRVQCWYSPLCLERILPNIPTCRKSQHDRCNDWVQILAKESTRDFCQHCEISRWTKSQENQNPGKYVRACENQYLYKLEILFWKHAAGSISNIKSKLEQPKAGKHKSTFCKAVFLNSIVSFYWRISPIKQLFIEKQILFSILKHLSWNFSLSICAENCQTLKCIGCHARQN